MAEPPLRDLCLQYKTVLEFMYKYHVVHGFFPTAESPEFYEFLQQNARPIVDMSQERVTRAVRFLEWSFREAVQERGITDPIIIYTLGYRLILSVPIWGVDLVNQMLDDDDPEAEELGNDNNIVQQEQGVNNILGDRILDQDEKHARDVAILRALIQFKDADSGVMPGADSVEFYEFAVGLPGPLLNIEQDVLVERILMLQERYFSQYNDPINHPETGEEIADPRKQELYNLSRQFWGYLVVQNLGNAAAGDDENENAGEDPDEYAGDDQDENAGDDQDENAGVDQDEYAGDDQDENSGDAQDENAGDDQDQYAGDDEDENAGEDQDEYAQDEYAGDDQDENAGDDQDQYAGDGQDENAGDDQDEYAGDEHDENAGNDQDGNADVENAGNDHEDGRDEEDDLGSAEDSP